MNYERYPNFKKITLTILVVTAILFSSFPSMAQMQMGNGGCPEYDPDLVSITGTLEERVFTDNSSGLESKNGKPEKYFVLKLDAPICVDASIASDAGREGNGIHELLFSFRYGLDSLEKYRDYLNKKVVVIGEMSRPKTAKPLRPVFIDVLRVRLVEMNNDCLEYEPAVVTLTGDIEEKVYHGALDYWPDNQPYIYWVLNLKDLVCVNASPINIFDGEERNVSIIQVGSDYIPNFYKNIKSYVSKKVIVIGELSHAFNAHQREKVLIEVKQIKLLESDR